MATSYNQIAGQNLGRLAGLSDGVFAFAMTLLVLDLHTPVVEAIHSEQDLGRSLVALGPRLVMYLMSFLTLGIFWNGQQAQLNHLSSGDRNLTWIHIAFLFTVTLIPFSTSLLAEFFEYRTALLAYWLNLVLLGGVLYLSWQYAKRANLIAEGAPPDLSRAVERRIVVAQSLYVLGALLCSFSTRWSIALIFLVQLYYAVAPRILKRKPGHEIELAK